MILDLARLLLFPALMAFAAASDLFTMTISNRISLALVAGFLVLAPLGGMGPYAIGLHVAAGLAVLVVAFGCFAMGWVGGGDAKLLAAAGLWLGWPAAINFVLYTALAGGALALLLVSARNTPLAVLTLRGPGWVQRLAEKGGPAPYGVAICFGALAAFPLSALVAAAGGGF